MPPRSRFTDMQIIEILKQAQSGVKISELCRMHGVTDTTFYNWRTKYSIKKVSNANRLKQLAYENRKLKQIIAGSQMAEQLSKSIL